MKILICGLGSIGRRHLQNLLHVGWPQEAVVLLRSGRSTLPDDELAAYTTETDLKIALDRWDPAAVVISNPTGLHLDLALPVAKSGKYILLEKPVSHSMERIQLLQESESAAANRILVGFQFRYHPTLQSLKQDLLQNRLGKILSAHVHWGEYLPGWHPWEDYRKSYSARADLGGGVAATLSHPFDYLRWLIGDVSELSATLAQQGRLELDVEDTAEVLLRFENGCLGHVHVNYNQRPARHYFEIVGSEGTARWDNEDGALHIWTTADKQWTVQYPPEPFERNDLFVEEVAHFTRMMKSQEKPRCGIVDGICVQQILAAIESSSRQRRWVPIDR